MDDQITYIIFPREILTIRVFSTVKTILIHVRHYVENYNDEFEDHDTLDDYFSYLSTELRIAKATDLTARSNYLHFLTFSRL